MTGALTLTEGNVDVSIKKKPGLLLVGKHNMWYSHDPDPVAAVE